MRLTERKIVATLRQHSYKLTPQRRVVIRAIASNQEHLTPTAIYEKVHHHHLICSNCGKVVDFPSCELEEAQQSLSKQTGFRIDGHLLEFIGLCQACQKEIT